MRLDLLDLATRNTHSNRDCTYTVTVRLASGTWGKAKAGAQLQVSIWDMGQGQSWGTVTG